MMGYRYKTGSDLYVTLGGSVSNHTLIKSGAVLSYALYASLDAILGDYHPKLSIGYGKGNEASIELERKFKRWSLSLFASRFTLSTSTYKLTTFRSGIQLGYSF